MSLLFLFLLPAVQQEDEPYIVVDKQALTLTYHASDGTPVKVYRIACGSGMGDKQRRGDRRTPEGTFRINQLLNARGLSHDFGDGKGPVKNAYGPWFLRLDVPAYHDIGIHGTHLPQSIGTRATEGCIRLTNEDITDLKSRVQLGTKVIILPDPEDRLLTFSSSTPQSPQDSCR